MSKFNFMGFLFFITGIIALMSVVGGIDTNPDLSVFQMIQLFAVSLVGFGCMVLGVSFMKDKEV
jgi:hypothetical protein